MIQQISKVEDILFSGASLLLTFLIFVNPGKKNINANRWLSVFMFCLFLITFDDIWKIAGRYDTGEFFGNVLGLASFIVAPAFYLSVSHFVESDRKWKITDHLHFVLSYLYVFLTIIDIFLDTPENSNGLDSTAKTVILFFNLFFTILIIIYCTMAFRKIVRHQKSIRLFASDVENINLKWLEYISCGVIAMALIWVLDINLCLTEKYEIYNAVASMLYLISIFFIAYHALKQGEIFAFNISERAEIRELINENTVSEVDRKRIIDDKKLEYVKEELLHVMETSKPHLKAGLSLILLAGEMKISSHVLSYVINKGLDENFYGFINRYRIMEAKKLLADPEMNHLSLVGIAFEVGFNSKTVFNTTFKNMTGQTPTEFKVAHQTIVDAADSY
jgi:AraC-like DNA-binding protein